MFSREFPRRIFRCFSIQPDSDSASEISTRRWTETPVTRTMVFAMNTTAHKTVDSSTETSASSQETASGVQQFPSSAPNEVRHGGVTAVEFQALKDEKLAVIRRALENGDYDSDAILEKALDRMLERLEEADTEQ